MSLWLAYSLLVCAAQPAPAPARLEWKFVEGESFVLERLFSQKQVIEINAKTFTQETTSAWLTSITVKEKNVRGAVLMVAIESVKSKSTGAGNGKALDDALAEKMKGLTFTLTVTPQGRITRLEGYEAFVKKLAEGKVDVEKSLRVLISEESLRDGWDEIFAFLPERAVSRGDKWKRSATESAPPFGSFKSVFEYGYDGEKDDLHTVLFTLKMTYQPAASPTDLIRVIKGGLKGDESSGTLLFDAVKGRLVRGEKSLKMHGELTIESLGKTIPLEFRCEHSLRIRVLDKKDDK